MKPSLRRVAAIAGSVLPSVTAFAFVGSWCYVPMWYDVSQQCESCAIYTDCPGRVLCTIVDAGGYPGTIVTEAVWCADFAGGTGNCAPPAVGGAPVSFSGPVVIPNQTCPGSCP